MGYPDVWIAVAAFYETSAIGDVIAQVRSVVDHVVCVDDDSKQFGRRRPQNALPHSGHRNRQAAATECGSYP